LYASHRCRHAHNDTSLRVVSACICWSTHTTTTTTLFKSKRSTLLRSVETNKQAEHVVVINIFIIVFSRIVVVFLS